MKKTILAAAAIVAMVSCNKNLIENPMLDSNYGYINLGITADTEMVVTKGIQATDVADIATYNVALLVKNGTNYVPYWTSEKFTEVSITDAGYIEYSELSDSKYWKVPAGEYKVVVENKTEEEALDSNGAIRVSGDDEFTVNAGSTNTVNIECSVINSKVTVSKTENFNKAFKTSSVSISGGDRTFGMNWTSTPDEVNPPTKSTSTYDAAFFNSNTEVSWNLQVTLTDGTTKEFSKSVALKTAVGTWNNIEFDASATDGSISVTVTVNTNFGVVDVITETINPSSAN